MGGGESKGITIHEEVVSSIVRATKVVCKMILDKQLDNRAHYWYLIKLNSFFIFEHYKTLDEKEDTPNEKISGSNPKAEFLEALKAINVSKILERYQAEIVREILKRWICFMEESNIS